MRTSAIALTVTQVGPFRHLLVQNWRSLVHKWVRMDKRNTISIKSYLGPMLVLLINKESSSFSPWFFLSSHWTTSCSPSLNPQLLGLWRSPAPRIRGPWAANLWKGPGPLAHTATDSASALISVDIINELLSSDVFPLLWLSNEGVCDLFDVQILNY